MPTAPTSRPVAPKQQPPPIQNFQLTKEDFTENTARVNTLMQQLITAVQALQGSGGRTALFSGIDVQGETVSGVGAPQGPTDAVSLSHAEANYSPQATASQFDVGGSSALKGLTNLYLQLQQGGSGTVTLAKLTGGGTNGSIVFKNGLMQSFVQPT